jgi:hypothetical protein
MAQLAYVFAGRNGLDSIALRNNILRIPEVSIKIREAQAILDAQNLASVHLHTYIASSEATFARNIKLRSLAAAIVQVGLYERLARTNRKPDILLGNINGDSALAVAIGRLSFEQMICSSPALETLKPALRLAAVDGVEPEPLLTGVCLTEYEAFAREDRDGDSAFLSLKSGFMDIKKMMLALVESDEVRTFIHIGPEGLACNELDFQGADDVEFLDSIELDPMLGWFWSAVRSDARVLRAQ